MAMAMVMATNLYLQTNLNKNMKHLKVLLSVFIIACITLTSCDLNAPTATPSSSSGVTKVTTKVATDLNGHTTEQNNIVARYAEDNKPGAIKHLYIISAYSGQVILYSTVKGKVTSSGKRLSPTTVSTNQPNTKAPDGIDVDISGTTYKTGEVLQDDGTYGSSVEYVYWFDSKNIYHQQYITGGMIVHVSSQPISVKNITINLEEIK